MDNSLAIRSSDPLANTETELIVSGLDQERACAARGCAVCCRDVDELAAELRRRGVAVSKDRKTRDGGV